MVQTWARLRARQSAVHFQTSRDVEKHTFEYVCQAKIKTNLRIRTV